MTVAGIIAGTEVDVHETLRVISHLWNYRASYIVARTEGSDGWDWYRVQLQDYPDDAYTIGTNPDYPANLTHTLDRLAALRTDRDYLARLEQAHTRLLAARNEEERQEAQHTFGELFFEPFARVA